MLGADFVAEVGVVPAQAATDGLGIRVEQQLVRVEAMALLRAVRAMHPVAVKQAVPFARQVAMPDEIGLLRHGDAFDLASAVQVEQAELDLGRVLGEEREIDALSVPRRAKRIRFARPDPARGVDCWFVHRKNRIGWFASNTRRRAERGAEREKSRSFMPNMAAWTKASATLPDESGGAGGEGCSRSIPLIRGCGC
ncbi:MAG: hypothetical protein QM739_01850 [Propionivibrio sp.]